MLFKSSKNWKSYLSPKDEERLNEILLEVAKYRGAYKNADEVKIAQLWCAILELKKQLALIYAKTKRLEEFFDALKRKFEEEEKGKRELVESLEKF